MANLAKEARDKAQIAWPGATVSERGKGWIKHQHPTVPNRFMLDSHIGPIHYGTSEDAEIDTAWEPGVLDDAPWLHKMVKAGFNVYSGPGTTDFDAGQIIRYVHPASGEDVTFEAQQLQWTNDLDQIEAIADPQTVAHTSIDDDTIHWQGAYGPGLDFRWQAQTARLAKYLTIQSLTAIGSPPQFIIDGGNPVLRLPFIFQKSSGVDIYIDGVLWNEKSNNPQTTSGNVEFRLNGESLWWFKQAAVSDSSLGDTEPPIPQQRFRAQAQNLFVEVLVPWTWLQSAVYPVEIDPTIDEQVGAGADDGYVAGTSTYNNSSVVYVGRGPGITNGRGWFRFTGISGLSGSTIDTSYFEPRFDSVVGTATKSFIHADDSAAPAAPTSISDYEAKTLTTASVAWDDGTGYSYEYIQSSSINTVIQELADSHDPSAIQIMWLDNSSANGNFYKLQSYDGSTAWAAKLHIEYTAGGGSPYSLILAQGSYALTGQAVDFKAARKMPAAQGSYALSGQPVAFKAARKMPVAQGSYSLTGQDAAFKAARKLTIAQGSYTLSGQAVGMSRGYMLALAQGSYALTGQAVGFKAARKLALAHGTYALTGQAVAFKAARTLALAQGSYTLTGFAVGFKTARKLAIAQGSYTLSGQDVIFTYTPVGGPTYTLALVQGSYVLSGQAVGFKAARKLALAHGVYTLTGQDVDMSRGYMLGIGQGSYALTGQNVAFKAARKLALAHGVYNLTGQDTGLTAARKLAIGQGSYVLSGQAIDLIIARILALNYGAYALTGYGVTLDYSGAIPIVTPDCRTFLISIDNRVYEINAENRVYEISAENRTLIIDCD